MDFAFTEEQRILRATIRDFLEKEITPIVRERDSKGPLNREETVYFIKKLMPFGYYIGGLPKEYGGLGLDNKTYGILYEELARSWAGLAGTINLTDIGFLREMSTFLTKDHLREKYLPRIKSGDLVIAAAITEPDVGSDTAGIKTSAVLDGDYYIINGTKEWISNGSICDVCNVLVQTDKTKGPLGIRMILVEKEISPFRTRDLPKLGLHAFPTSELGFEDCRVPRENMSDLSAEVAYSTLMKGFDIARPMWALHATGISQAAIDASINYAKERFQFGRPIGKFQLIQNMIYEMITETEAGQLLGYRALDLADKGERCRKEASMAKAYATEAAVRVTSMAIEIHGAMGLSQDLALERYFRDARTWTIPDGTTEIQKLIVAGEVLGIRAYV